MIADLEFATLSDSLHKLNSAPENFSAFYRKLEQLRFPLDVADVLEMRYLFNHAVDQMPHPHATRDFRQFRTERQAEMEAAGVENERHSERLLKLLAMLRQLHLAHVIESRDAEAELRRALTNNKRAARNSSRYGRITLVVTLIAGAFWWFAGTHWWTQVLPLGLGYLSADYFYSLSILRRERDLLRQRLHEVLDKRVATLNWTLLIRNLALILGYAKVKGIEAFELHGDVDETRLYV